MESGENSELRSSGESIGGSGHSYGNLGVVFIGLIGTPSLVGLKSSTFVRKRVPLKFHCSFFSKNSFKRVASSISNVGQVIRPIDGCRYVRL